MSRVLLKRLLPPIIWSAIREVVLLYRLLRLYGSIRRRRTKDDPVDWLCKQPSDSNQDLACTEYRFFSQNGEDGIIRYLLSQIGVQARLFLEFGFSPVECNCLRLAAKEGFGGLFIDRNRNCVRQFRRAARFSRLRNVQAVAILLTVENLERTVMAGGLHGDIDVASIDVDGNDYWLWERLQCVSPRIVVIEYNASLGPTLSLTVPYDPLFDRHKKHSSGFYCGASITALQRLGARKGYRFVGCDSTGVNAFFLRKDCQAPAVKTVSPEQGYRPHNSRIERGFSMQTQYEMIKDLPYVQID